MAVYFPVSKETNPSVLIPNKKKTPMPVLPKSPNGRRVSEEATPSTRILTRKHRSTG